MLLVGLILAVFLHRRWNRAKLYLLMNVIVHAIYSCSIGLDFMPKHRHQVMVLPFLTLVCAMGFRAVEQLAMRVHRWLATALGLVLLSAGIWCSLDVGTKEIEFHTSAFLGQRLDIRREIGLHLKEATKPGTIIATGECGKISYFARRDVMDLSGINDVEIGKSRPYVQAKPAGLPLKEILRRRAGVILIPSFQLGLSREPVQDPKQLTPVSTFSDPLFLRYYELRRERVAGLHFCLYRRRPDRSPGATAP